MAGVYNLSCGTNTKNVVMIWQNNIFLDEPSSLWENFKGNCPKARRGTKGSTNAVCTVVFPSMAEALHLILECKSLTQDYRLKSTIIAFNSTPLQWLPNSKDIRNFLCKNESSQHLFRLFTLQLSRKLSNLGILI